MKSQLIEIIILRTEWVKQQKDDDRHHKRNEKGIKGGKDGGRKIVSKTAINIRIQFGSRVSISHALFGRQKYCNEGYRNTRLNMNISCFGLDLPQE